MNFYSQANSYINPQGGNVGIGNVTPAYKLDITGDVRATGTIYGNATSANSVPWSGVTGKPTTVSAFTNDNGYITATNPNYYVTPGDGNGLCFWSDCTNYKISMGVGSLYQYGTVSDYSLKMQMDQ